MSDFWWLPKNNNPMDLFLIWHFALGSSCRPSLVGMAMVDVHRALIVLMLPLGPLRTTIQVEFDIWTGVYPQGKSPSSDQ